MKFCERFTILWILGIVALIFQVEAVAYDVHWLEGSTTIERDASKLQQNLDIYCYTGISKNILSLWQTVKFNVKVVNDEYKQYMGENPQEVFDKYLEDTSYGWSVNPFQRKPQNVISLSIFTPTCMAINTKHKHNIELQMKRVDLWRVSIMVLGLGIIFSSKILSGNRVFFYVCGILLGVFASFMVLVYYVSKMLPKKTLTYGILIGGWTVGIYIFQQMFENIRNIVISYQNYMFWYTLVVSFISFIVCYKIGPPTNRKSKNIVMWTLQCVGIVMIFFSSDYQEATATIIVLALMAKYFPDSLIHKIQGYWRRKFPPKMRLLTNEEYYEQGARETKKALEDLRKYCSSPDCAQWRIMLKLNNSQRFASFVEGDSHLSDDEIMNYETYAFSMEASMKSNHMNNSVRDMEISDDDSSGVED